MSKAPAAAKGAKKAKGDTKPYEIEKKRSGRYAVKTAKGFVNGIEKVKILLAEGLIKTKLPKEAPAAEAAPAAAEAPAAT